MKKWLMLGVLVWPGVALGQLKGCFVYDGDTECASDHLHLDDCYYSQENYSYWLGDSVGHLCHIAVTYADAYERKREAIGRCLDSWSATIDDWESDSKRKTSLISRLRKACGSKCRKIK